MTDITITHPDAPGVTFTLSSSGTGADMFTLRAHSDDMQDELGNPKLLTEVGFPRP
ncbi:hypothetical protein PBI_LAMBO_32 [Gordonia phage Lambo]|uniref:Uncharacterized protein n=2 Tax=Lambovirus TaxID=2843412 RepID=A0A5J6TYT6_9CAUD|nr:membrane protein [Gordonia phage Lambo]QFG13542.1 hypothetical protein PBI_LAMBO_32 [Gordonia phage Lambo]WNM67178.1 hypothetical protein SEA_ERUTAN_32 [Gordonia phage Erutan]